MTHFCICIKIHIPAIQRNYRFFNINREHSYFDENKIRNHVTTLCSENLNPFLGSLRTLSIESDGNFKAAVSISGITLKLLQKYSPEIIEQLFELEQNNCIELLSQTWSNSLVPFIDEKMMIRQIRLHDKTVFSLFGKIPKTFIAHSPLSSLQLFKTTINRGKKGIFTFLNPKGITTLKIDNANSCNQKTIDNVYLINQKMSELFHHINYNQNKNPISFSSLLFDKIKKYIPPFNPLIVCFNPTFAHQNSKNNGQEIWKLVIKKLLDDSEIIFTFPDEIIHNYKHFSCEGFVSDSLCRQFKLTDFWLQNPLQSEAFNKQKEINGLMQFTSEKGSYLTEWEIIQDKEFLYYMDNHFIQKKYCEFHFNPFSSPYLAFINYMNILDDISERLLHTKSTFMNTRQLTIS